MYMLTPLCIQVSGLGFQVQSSFCLDCPETSGGLTTKDRSDNKTSSLEINPHCHHFCKDQMI